MNILVPEKKPKKVMQRAWKVFTEQMSCPHSEVTLLNTYEDSYSEMGICYMANYICNECGFVEEVSLDTLEQADGRSA